MADTTTTRQYTHGNSVGAAGAYDEAQPQRFGVLRDRNAPIGDNSAPVASTAMCGSNDPAAREAKERTKAEEKAEKEGRRVTHGKLK